MLAGFMLESGLQKDPDPVKQECFVSVPGLREFPVLVL